jgi:hypothetical protein
VSGDNNWFVFKRFHVQFPAAKMALLTEMLRDLERS